jgi:hypothetical protein
MAHRNHRLVPSFLLMVLHNLLQGLRIRLLGLHSLLLLALHSLLLSALQRQLLLSSHVFDYSLLQTPKKTLQQQSLSRDCFSSLFPP